MSNQRLAFRLWALVLLTAAILGCGNKSAPAPAAPEPAPAAAAAPTVPTAERTALVTYYSGSVSKAVGSSWADLAIGDRVGTGDTVRTGTDSFCELQVGQAAVVRLQEATTVEVQDILATTERTDSTISVAAGSVLCKVQRLSDADRFRVKTDSAVCGVRGTEFSVTIRQGGETLVSVKKGRVAVLPAAADVDAVRQAVEASAPKPAAGAAVSEEQTKAIQAIQEQVAAIEAAAPVVAENQEVLVAARPADEVTKALKEVEQQAVEMAKTSTAPAQASIQALDQLVSSVTKAAAAAVERPAEISVESVRALAATDQMRIIEVPSATAAQPAPTLYKISVTVEPAEAEVQRDGATLAVGSYHGLFPEGEKIDFTFRLDGYKTQTLSITSGKDAEAPRQVRLEEDTRPVSVRATPQDAAILLDGKSVGTGSYDASYRPGQQLSFTVQREGYKSATLQVQIPETGTAAYSVTLEKLPPPEKKVEEVRIEAQPFGAEILVNGSVAGSGSYSTSVEAGTRLEVTVRKDGFKPQTLSITVPKGGTSQSVVLVEEKETVAVVATPRDAEIVLDGKVVGTGSFSREFSRGQALTFLVRKKDYGTEVLEVAVERGSGRTYTVQLREEKEQIGIVTQPTDAEIVVNGTSRGQGRFAADYSRGQKLAVTVRKAGYFPKSLDIDVVAGSSRTYAVELEQMMESFTFDATPADAEIVIGGKQVGTGTYTERIAVGRQVEVTVRKPGYKTSTIPIDVTAGSGKTFTVRLEQMMESFTFAATPRDAEVVVDGTVRAKGTSTASYPVGSRIAVTIRRDGYTPQSFDIAVTEGSGRRQDVVLQRIVARLTVQTDPPDARILRDGAAVGSGSYAADAPAGEAVILRVERLGYAPQDVRIDPTDGNAMSRNIVLEPRPVVWRQRAGTGGFTWAVSTEGDTAFVADKTGTLLAVGIGGALLWSVPTANTPNENSVPVLAAGTVYLSGSKELVAVDARTGAVRARVSLAPTESHIFGRHVNLVGSTLVVPADDGLRLVDPMSLKVLRSIVVKDGTQMSAASRGMDLFIANQQGVFMALAADSGTTRWEVATQAVQPIAVAPVVAGSRAYFAGRKGNVVCVDVDSHAIVWQTELESGKSIGVFQELTVADGTVLVFAKNAVYALSAATGKPLFDPLREANTPALLAGGTLTYGKIDGTLVIADARTGAQRAAFALEAKGMTQPVLSGTSVLVGTDKGELLLVATDVILRQAGR